MCNMVRSWSNFLWKCSTKFGEIPSVGSKVVIDTDLWTRFALSFYETGAESYKAFNSLSL